MLFEAPTLAFPPQRVVSLVPSVTESLFDLDLGERVVGRTDYCIQPKGRVERVPSVGGTKTPDVERILALAPHLVIANYEENRRQDVEALQAAGIPVWVTFPQTVQEALNLLWEMMNLFDHQTMVARVRLIEYTYDWVNSIALSNEDQVVKVFVPIWSDPLMTFNQETYMHDMVRVCGGTNIFAQMDRGILASSDFASEGEVLSYEQLNKYPDGLAMRYPKVSLAEVVAHQPNVILLPSEPFHFQEHHLALFQSLDVPAAKQGRIHLVDGSLLSWHGTRIAYALEQLPKLIRPVE